jgi:hypothetical protein
VTETESTYLEDDDVCLIIGKDKLPQIIVPKMNDYDEVPEHVLLTVAVGVFFTDDDFKKFVMDKWNSIQEEETETKG